MKIGRFLSFAVMLFYCVIPIGSVYGQKDTCEFRVDGHCVIGWKDNGVLRATGIQYAVAERYKMPEPIVFPDTLYALKWSKACPQITDDYSVKMFGGDVLERLEKNENCLHLSIAMPEMDSLSFFKLPVMVWIHGGGYTTGAGDASDFDPWLLVKEQNVIVVNVTYRLGLLGFMGGFEGHAANLGYLDVMEALKWVKKYISYFGGDPDNVTLFGQSAGGDMVAQLMIADGTQELFRNVIIQSAPLGLISGRSKMIAKMINVAEILPDKASIDSIIIKEKEVLKSAMGFGFKSFMPFGVRYGYYPFPEENEIWENWKNRASGYNILIGTAKEETSFFLPLMPSLQKLCNIPLLGELIKFIVVKYTSFMVYGKPANKLARICREGGANVYRYKIFWGSKINGFGATHTIELPLLFGNKDPWWKNAELVRGIQQEEVMSKGKLIRAMWSDFARTGKLQESGEISGVLKYKRK